jgi:hypothetical protein
MSPSHLFAVFALAVAVSATVGVDVSQLFPVSSWQCVRNYGYTFAIVRCYMSTGKVDPNCAASVNNAWSGGMDHVDIYMFPCPKCGNAKGQIQTLYNAAKNIKYGQMWIDIEGTEYWLGSYSANRQFFNELSNAAVSIFGKKYAGVYANKVQWTGIFGDWSDWSSRLKLWVANWDYEPQFSHFTPFCGWTAPVMKQYAGDQAFCSMNVDKNFY